MKKVKLDLDGLNVESFETHAVEGSGTVVGAAAGAVGVIEDQIRTYPNCSEIDACPSALGCSYNGTCYDPTCNGGTTCVSTCTYSCGGFNTGCSGCSGPVCVA